MSDASVRIGRVVRTLLASIQRCKDGAALVIHQGADDYRSQPAGAAGPRIACGVIDPNPGREGADR
jgi:Cu/Zn superoxide dismutase